MGGDPGSEFAEFQVVIHCASSNWAVPSVQDVTDAIAATREQVKSSLRERTAAFERFPRLYTQAPHCVERCGVDRPLASEFDPLVGMPLSSGTAMWFPLASREPTSLGVILGEPSRRS